MNMENIQHPQITVDMKKSRIRVHKATIHQMGDPGYMLLLINPDKQTICLCHADQNDRRAHRIHISRLTGGYCYELYSKSLIAALRDVRPEFDTNNSYRISGDYFQQYALARFQMADAEIVTQ